MSGHAKLSPSSSSRWLNCPGSIAAIAALPEGPEESSIYADEGTFAHSIAERALDPVISFNAPVEKALGGLLGTKSECGRFTADTEMLNYLEEYVEFCCDAFRQSGEAMVEVLVHAVPDKVYGTADFVAVVGNVLEVADLKYGAGVPVHPFGNTQAMIYAIGAIKKIAIDRPELFDQIDTVRIRIFQPRNKAGGGVVELTVTELLEWRGEVLLPGAAFAETEGAPRIAGDHCRFCPVAGTCYAKKEAALEGAAAVFSNVDELEVVSSPPNPKDLTLEEVAKVLKAAPLIESWLKGVRAYAYERAKAGDTIEGYKLVRKVGNRAWSDEKAVVTMLHEMLPVGASTHAEPKLLSPAQAEKKLDVLGKAMVDKLTTKPDTGTTLVPKSDRRQAFLPGDVFNIIE